MQSRDLTPAARAVLAAGAAAGTVALARAAAGVPTALGASPRRLRAAADRAAAAGSAQVADGRFHNALPGEAVERGSTLAVLHAVAARGRIGHPTRPVPVTADPAPERAAGLALTWYGHSSVLLELDGYRVLADPVWSERVSPSRTVGPRRLHPAPVPLSALPPVDAVVISHDHYDHLDLPTVRALLPAGRGPNGAAPFVVPLGVGAHLRRWGVPDARIVELDWGGSARVGDLVLTCTEARHFSGRRLRRNTTLWSSWVVTGPRHRAFFGGDTGYTPAFVELGRTYGPFDLALMPIGAYSALWPLIHMTPEEAVRAHGDLTGGTGLLVPVHWATFNLGFHPWSEPVRRMHGAATDVGARTAVPLPGQRIDVAAPPPQVDWWVGVDDTPRPNGRYRGTGAALFEAPGTTTRAPAHHVRTSEP
jgi:L-ascorbate metabolism protein UlaG (beta-lactamase superfamily)